jgi:flagellar hook-associated protein 3 FlgL
MRVTFNSVQHGVERLSRVAHAFDRAQEQVETGRRIHRPSDDPAAIQRIVQGRAEIAGFDAYTNSADAAASRLSMIDTILTSVVDQLTEATATATGARGSTVTPAAREAAARKLEEIRDSLAGSFNSSVRGNYLFAGSESLTKPIVQVAGAWTYAGDNTAVTVPVGLNQSAEVTLDGEAIIQGSDPTNLFTDIDTLAAAIRAGDSTAVGNGIAALGRAFDRATRAQSHLGADIHGVEQQQAQLTRLRLASQQRVSRDQDADLAEAIANMNRLAVAYRAALGSVGATLRESLMDYIR